MQTAHDNPREYRISVESDNIREAVASVASALYALAEEALGILDDQDVEEGEFEVFLRDLLGVLTRHAEHLSESSSSWEAADKTNPRYD